MEIYDSGASALSEQPPACPKMENTTDDTIDQTVSVLNERSWIEFGFEAAPAERRTNRTTGWVSLDGMCLLPRKLFALVAERIEANERAAEVTKLIASPGPPLCFHSEGRVHYVFRFAEGEEIPASLHLPDNVALLLPGSSFPEPDQLPGKGPYQSLSDLPPTRLSDLAELISPRVEPAMRDSPFASYSLLGRSAEYEALAVAALPLLGLLCMTGQATIWYAPPNAGKTLVCLKLLIDAVMGKRINPANVYYINADDSSQGMAEKLTLMDELGIHTLVPGHRGFKPEQLIDLLREAAQKGKARGQLVVIDTVKKFTSLMDKAKASAFADACRAFVMAGGTVVGFAHTNKKPSVDGRLTYSGTTDLLDDFDAAYILTPMRVDDHDETAVTFESMKRRGSNVETATFAYARDPGITYAERLASVYEVDPAEVQGFRRREAEQDSGAVIAVVKGLIGRGVVGKMALAKKAAPEADVSERSVIRILEQFAGDDPQQHHWQVKRGARGVRQYAVLSQPGPPGEESTS